MSSITTLAPRLQYHLTVTAEAATRASGCVQRVRAFSGPTLIQTLVLGWLANPDASLSELCQWAAARGVRISPQGLTQRFTADLASALHAVLAAMVRDVVVGPSVRIPLLERLGPVWLLDSTTISLPAALADLWAGCGGRPGQGRAAVKVVLELEVCRGQVRGPVLQAGRVPDRSALLADLPHAPGSLLLRDLGFFSLARLAAAQTQGEHWLSRLMAGTIVWTADGQRWTQTALLRQQTAPVVDLPVELGGRHRLPARLLACRVPANVAQQRRRRLRQEARKKGQPVSPDRLALADWTVLVTSCSVADLSLAEALVLLRARWQIEQLFDLWKTHGGLARSRSRQPWRILAEVYAKLIGLVLQHWLLLHGDWAAPNRSWVKGAQVVRASVRLLAATLDHPRQLREVLRQIGTQLQAAGRLNRRKRHPNTYQWLLDPAGTTLT